MQNYLSNEPHFIRISWNYSQSHIKKLHEDIIETQFKFNSGTRKAIGKNILIQRSLDMNVVLHLCLINYENAFDQIKHQRLLEIILEKSLHANNIRIIQNLYWNKKAIIMSMDITLLKLKFKKASDIMSPFLFFISLNMYSKKVLKRI